MAQLTKDDLRAAAIQDTYRRLRSAQLVSSELDTLNKQMKFLETERIGFLDIEASNLSADFGYVFSYAIKSGNEILGRVLSGKEIKKFIFDEKLMNELCIDLRKFDRIITHYGGDRKFDIPYLRTRCIKYGLDFPVNKSIWSEDTYVISKNKLRLSRNRLENLAVFFGIEAKQHKLDPSIWQKAMAGHEPSLQYIWKHNVEDVVSLAELWYKVFRYVMHGKISI